MPEDFSTINHYVPRWYQHSFTAHSPGPRRYHYLDMKPSRVNHPDGSYHYRTARRWLGPDLCFQQKHLYTLLFREQASDVKAPKKEMRAGVDRRRSNDAP